MVPSRPVTPGTLSRDTATTFVLAPSKNMVYHQRKFPLPPSRPAFRNDSHGPIYDLDTRIRTAPSSSHQASVEAPSSSGVSRIDFAREARQTYKSDDTSKKEIEPHTCSDLKRPLPDNTYHIEFPGTHFVDQSSEGGADSFSASPKGLDDALDPSAIIQLDVLPKAPDPPPSPSLRKRVTKLASVRHSRVSIIRPDSPTVPPSARLPRASSRRTTRSTWSKAGHKPWRESPLRHGVSVSPPATDQEPAREQPIDDDSVSVNVSRFSAYDDLNQDPVWIGRIRSIAHPNTNDQHIRTSTASSSSESSRTNHSRSSKGSGRSLLRVRKISVRESVKEVLALLSCTRDEDEVDEIIILPAP